MTPQVTNMTLPRLLEYLFPYRIDLRRLYISKAELKFSVFKNSFLRNSLGIVVRKLHGSPMPPGKDWQMLLLRTPLPGLTFATRRQLAKKIENRYRVEEGVGDNFRPFLELLWSFENMFLDEQECFWTNKM
jgi:hypothetical protein